MYLCTYSLFLKFYFILSLLKLNRERKFILSDLLVNFVYFQLWKLEFFPNCILILDLYESELVTDAIEITSYTITKRCRFLYFSLDLSKMFSFLGKGKTTDNPYKHSLLCLLVHLLQRFLLEVGKLIEILMLILLFEDWRLYISQLHEYLWRQ